MSLQNDLRAVLIREGYSTNSIANVIGVDQSSIAKWLRGERGLSMDSFEKLCDYLEVSLCVEVNYEAFRPEWKEGESDYDEAIESYYEAKDVQWEVSEEYIELDDDSDEDEVHSEWSQQYDRENREKELDRSFEFMNSGPWPDMLADHYSSYPIRVLIDWADAQHQPDVKGALQIPAE